MSAVEESLAGTLESRARQSRGMSDRAIYEAVARSLDARRATGGVLVDVGCGGGGLWEILRGRFARYIGVDAVHYEELPDEVEFTRADLDSAEIPIADESADITVSGETIEHLENPRAFMRELARITRRGGLIVVTTPNQLSLLSLLTLVVKHRFSAFQDAHYPAHLTALLEIDLRRIAAECGLTEIEIAYTEQGRIVLTPWRYPSSLARLAPRLCSDNLLLVARRPRG